MALTRVLSITVQRRQQPVQQVQRRVVAAAPQRQVDAAAQMEAARQGLQRFIQMAAEDREDDWDSDELEGDDDMWQIPDAPPREQAVQGQRVLMPFLQQRR